MAIDFANLNKLNEGKTKIIYESPEDAAKVYMVFKDDITAGDGAKHDTIKGKAVIDWQINRDIFELLNRAGLKTHYVSSPEERVSLVRKLDQKINLEVVTRRVATGSIVKWGQEKEGTRYDPVITQFHYKDDMLHDPMIDEGYIDYLVEAKGAKEYAGMREMNPRIFLLLEKAFAQFKIQLVDIKLEYGLIAGGLYLIDEITGGSFRLWPYAHDNPDLNQPNVLDELNPGGRMDKDTYRMGEAAQTVKSRFEQIAHITAEFPELKA